MEAPSSSIYTTLMLVHTAGLAGGLCPITTATITKAADQPSKLMGCESTQLPFACVIIKTIPVIINFCCSS